MRKLLSLTLLASVFLLFSCRDETVYVEGPQGPQGVPGPQGIPGESGFAFEYEGINFTGPEFEVFLELPADFEVFSSDVALVYLLWDVQDVGGIPTDVWRPLPQTILTNNGLLQYNYDFTLVDIRLFLEAEFSLASLTAMDTDEWIARVVIVPANFWDGGRVDRSISYQELSASLGLQEPHTNRKSIERRP